MQGKNKYQDLSQFLLKIKDCDVIVSLKIFNNTINLSALRLRSAAKLIIFENTSQGLSPEYGKGTLF